MTVLLDNAGNLLSLPVSSLITQGGHGSSLLEKLGAQLEGQTAWVPTLEISATYLPAGLPCTVIKVVQALISSFVKWG